MYKDKDRQREADRERQRRRRDKIKAKGVTDSGCDKQGVTVSQEVMVIAKPERTARGNIRVSKPGDADYVPQCETTKAFIEGRPKDPSPAKRGKDIKTFEDLPPDVQESIRTVSESNEEFKRRTGIAIRYQHLFPDRYHSTTQQPLMMSKPT